MEQKSKNNTTHIKKTEENLENILHIHGKKIRSDFLYFVSFD